MLIDPQLLQRASSDPRRIDAEVAKFDRDPSAYIEENFQALAQCDFPTFAAINIRITTKDGRAASLRFNRVQQRLWRLILEALAAGRAIRFYIFKARQMGVSTFIFALFYWLA